MPKTGATVVTKDNRKGTVTALNQLKESVRVRFEDKESGKTEFVDVPIADIVSKGKGSASDDVRTDPAEEELKNLLD